MEQTCTKISLSITALKEDPGRLPPKMEMKAEQDVRSKPERKKKVKKKKTSLLAALSC